jgi:hypothetical protein
VRTEDCESPSSSEMVIFYRKSEGIIISFGNLRNNFSSVISVSLIFVYLQNESAAILKIKESMQEEAKRFEKESEAPPDFYMQ